MKIGIMSDTHGIFREDWHTYLDDCDLIIHAGDIHTRNCYDKLKGIGVPLYMVRGNNDIGEWARFLPEFLQVPIGGKIFFIVHNKSDLPFDLTDADFIIYGHTHQFATYERYGKVFLNPGSAGQGRGDVKSLVLMDLNETGYQLERVFL